VFLLASGAIPAFFSLIFVVVLIGGIALAYLTTGTLYLKFDWPLLLCPIPLVIAFLLCIGICCFVSVAFLLARDVRYVIPLLTQFWFYLTPVIYTLEVMPSNLQFAISHFNPLAAQLEFFRWTLFGIGTWDATALLTSIVVSCAMFLLGVTFLMRSEWALSELI
jgi:lipopolysaccharide transport system permease protein